MDGIFTKAYCPASVSLIFNPFIDKKNLARSGSTGVGFTISELVFSQVLPFTKNKVYLNGTEIYIPTLARSLKNLTEKKLKITLFSKLPLAGGFGLSSALSFATLIAANKHLNLERSLKELGQIVHESEIIEKTGLGTLTTQITGGFLVKTVPGLDFKYYPLPFVGLPVYFIFFKPLQTPAVLKSEKALKNIKKASDEAFLKIHKRTTFAEMLDIAFSFDKTSGLAPKDMINIMNEIKLKGAHAAMAMLGKVIITDKPPHSDFPGARIYKSSVSQIQPGLVL